MGVRAPLRGPCIGANWAAKVNVGLGTRRPAPASSPSQTPSTPATARPIAWQLATVVDAVPETLSVRTLVLDVPAWHGHRAGQPVDVRLTAEDRYQAERSYTIASPLEDARIALTIERLDDGEVSPYLTEAPCPVHSYPWRLWRERGELNRPGRPVGRRGRASRSPRHRVARPAPALRRRRSRS